MENDTTLVDHTRKYSRSPYMSMILPFSYNFELDSTPTKQNVLVQGGSAPSSPQKQTTEVRFDPWMKDEQCKSSKEKNPMHKETIDHSLKMK